MKRFVSALVAASMLAGVAGAAPAFADPYDGHRDRGDWHRDRHDGWRGGYGGHDWRRGDRIGRDEWVRYQRVDYRRYRLRPPPRGYEWRYVNNNYVLAALATGLIVDIVAGHR